MIQLTNISASQYRLVIIKPRSTARWASCKILFKENELFSSSDFAQFADLLWQDLMQKDENEWRISDVQILLNVLASEAPFVLQMTRLEII
jgi:hypothetical protein